MEETEQMDIQMRNIYWSHLKMMRACPRQYLWHKGHPNHDLGAGYGKPKPLPEEKKESEHHQLMGTVLSYVVECVYNHQLYTDPQNLLKKVLEITREAFEEAEKRHYVLWTYMTRDQALDICLQGARNFLEIMKEHRLLGPYAKSELKMTPAVNNYFSVCGIADLVYRDKEDNIHILDGKNASTPMKYEDEDQLRWYALCFRLQYGVLPHRLGFFYFRYPSSNPPENHNADPEKEWTGLVEVSITEEDIKRLGEEAVQTNLAIHKGVFEPNPMPKHCRVCKFENICEERQAQKAHNAAKRGMVKVTNKDPVIEGGTSGFVDLSFK
jgi:RecB family exonuclease